ncbi:MAG: sulfotransferase [Candidatus Bathyarchaeota archaeon]|nr:MAG: sulfotransferase [Candidatus Bathyarchaeota archaeon]
MDGNYVTIVSGLPRSGTSMMMAMLQAGGMEVLTDEIRKADEDNPGGYFEFERVKQVKEDRSWLPGARGKVIKMISALLDKLPSSHHYKVVFMERNIDEVLASQMQMLVRRGEPTDAVGDDEMRTLFHKHLRQMREWLEDQPNFAVLYVSYNDTLEKPRENSEKVNDFLGGTLDVDQMVSVVDKGLYRQRHS